LQVFTPVLAGNGVTVDMENLDRETATEALMACFEVVVPSMQAAG
jgi:hypothetical protein